jgi:ankyrin repeat protein
LGRKKPSTNLIILEQCAAKSHNIKLIEFLLQSGAEINASDDDGEYVPFRSTQTVTHGLSNLAVSRTSLHVQLSCTSNGSDASETSLFLISHGADIMTQSVSGATPLHNFYTPTVELILKYHSDCIDIETEDDQGMTFFHYMAWSSRSSVEIARLYVENAAGAALLLARDRAGRIPLHLAAQRGNIPLVAYMLEIMVSKKIDLMQRDLMGRTAMHYALESKRTGIITLLAEKGVSIHTADVLRRTPLHHAATKRHVGSLKVLLELGATDDLHAVDEKGRTPLDLARRRKDASEIVLCLLAFEAGEDKIAEDLQESPNGVFEYQNIPQETEGDEREEEERYCLSPLYWQTQSTDSGYRRTSRLTADLVLMILGIFLWKCLKPIIPSLSL